MSIFSIAKVQYRNIKFENKYIYGLKKHFYRKEKREVGTLFFISSKTAVTA